MHNASLAVRGKSVPYAESYINDLLQNLAKEKNIHNLNELIEQELEKRKKAATPYTL